MKKVFLSLAAAALALTATFTACDDDEQMKQLIAVLGVSLDQASITLPVGATLTLMPTVLPENATNKKVMWASSNTAVAIVSDNGKVTARNLGKATITATTEDSKKTASCALTVSNDTEPPTPPPGTTVAVTGVRLSDTIAWLVPGSNTTLTATVQPSNATNKNVSWTSSNTAIATVSNGLVNAVAQGTATITVTTQDGNKTATCAVTVIAANAAVTGVTLNRVFATLGISESLTLIATVQPETATNKTVTWSSSNPTVATVTNVPNTSNATVTAVAQGTATITATTQDGSYTATCNVTVEPVYIPVASVIINTATALLHNIGDTFALTATILPASATNKAVAWSSSNPAVAVVYGGTVTAINVGTATITVTTADGGKTATCAVTVGTPVTGVTLNKTATTLVGVGDTETLTATVQPSNATNKNVSWSSSNTAVATVTNGLVTAIAWGTVTITATTEEGNKTATCTVIVGLGTVSFATTQTWTIGAQTWSDAVQTTVCSGKTSYNGGAYENPQVDCRSNPGQKGDLFSWRAVSENKSQLCPEGWRVPLLLDFIDLDIALGGTGSNSEQTRTWLRNNYLNTWGGVYGGYCYSDGSLNNQGSGAYYWSQSEGSSYNAYYLAFASDGNVYPQNLSTKYYGLSLRCVR